MDHQRVSIRNRGDAYRIHLQEILTRFVYRRHLPKMFTGYAHRRCLQDTLTGYAYRSSNSPGKAQICNCFIFNILEILNLPGDTNLASPGKWLFAMILIIRWLQIKGLPGDICTSKSQWLEQGSSEGITAVWSRKGTKEGTPNRLKTANRDGNGAFVHKMGGVLWIK